MKYAFMLAAAVALGGGAAWAAHPPEEFILQDGEVEAPQSPEAAEASDMPSEVEEFPGVQEDGTEVLEPPAEFESEVELDWGVETEIEEVAAESEQ